MAVRPEGADRVCEHAWLMFIEFTLSQRKAEFYRGVVNALNFFGGSSRAIIFDNLKSAVINGSGRAACFHPEFLALCGYFCLRTTGGSFPKGAPAAASTAGDPLRHR